MEVRRWQRDLGDETLRLDYQLNADSVVFDLGGYVGDFAQQIHNKFGCRVYVFEPHPQFYETCVDRFKSNGNITVLKYGIADVDGEFYLADDADGSSFLETGKPVSGEIRCELRKIDSVLTELDIKKIDLMKINIEGGEYPLLEHMALKNTLAAVVNFQIQFHDFIENATQRRKTIIDALEKSHSRTWCYEFVWENWHLMQD